MQQWDSSVYRSNGTVAAVVSLFNSAVGSAGLGLVLVKYQYEYEGRDGALVSIKPDERYVLLAKTNDHWWQVRRDHNSKPFYIPAKYVKELPLDFPSPLDFDPPDLEPVSLPVTTPVPVPVPVPVPFPKTLDEPSGTKTKVGDEVTIRLRPDTSTGYRKSENRMSTFGVPLDLQDVSPLVVPTPRYSGNPPAAPTETRTTNMADDVKKHLSGVLEDHWDSGKHQAHSPSPADPLSAPQPIPVETPVVPPTSNPQKKSSPSGHDQESPIELGDSTEEEEEGDSPKDEDSNHIYESIQDLNLDVEALVGGRASPEVPPEPVPAAPHTQVRSSSPTVSAAVVHVVVLVTALH